MDTTIKQSFLIGDEWLYYKIYTGFSTTDTILTHHLHAVITGLLEEGILDKWFFIRYTDPDHHIRLRVHLVNTEQLGKVMLAFQECLRNLWEQNSIWKLQTDTYSRELKRYGATLITEAETIFFHDSHCITAALTVLEEPESENTRWIFGMASIDTFLDTFGYPIHEKRTVMESLREGFFKEFKVDTPTKKGLSAKYREHKNEIAAFMKTETGALKQLLTERNTRLAEPVAAIREKIHHSGKTLNDLLGSYIHMNMNRLFPSNNRQCEMIIYDLLCSYYTTEMAIAKKQQLQKEAAAPV